MPAKNAVILVVEDNFVNQKVALAQLDQLGFLPDIASSGIEALSRAQNTWYDIILMDCELPDLSGEEVARQLRRWENSEGRLKSYIIAVTAHSSDHPRGGCFSAGMDEYLTKPIRLENLRDALAKALPILGPSRIDEPREESLETAPDNFELDPATLEDLKMLSGDDAGCSITELVTVFFEDSPPIFETLLKAVEERNFQTITAAAHKLSGSASLFGALTFSELCRTIENEARAANISAILKLMPRVRIGFEKTRAALEALESSLQG